MVLKLYFILAVFVFAFCSMPDRDNEFDPESKNYYSSSSENSSSSEIVFGTLDYEGQTYKTVVIGEQAWMAENLNYNVEGSKCYGEGVAGFSEEEVLNNCKKYGRLYDWETAKNVCPTEWYLPNKEDWDKLTEFIRYNYNHDYIKDYVFLALPAGEGTVEGGYGSLGINGYWWSLTENFKSWSYENTIVFVNEDMNLIDGYKEDLSSKLYSVRCIKSSLFCNGIEYNPKIQFCHENIIYEKTKVEEYKTVKIGEQTWMAENLRDKISGTKCYNDNTENCEIFGVMFNWNMAMNACPVGWHLPNDNEWNTLEEFIEDDSDCSNCAGTKLKANSSLWVSGIGTDDYGFTALPGGLYAKSFKYKGEDIYFWSATRDSYNTSNLRIFSTSMYISDTILSKDEAFAYVRCIKDN